MSRSKKILISSFLLATCVIVERLLAIRLPVISIGFKFIPFMFSAILLGPKYSTIIGILSDIIGRLLFPMSGYFPGFTLSAAITGYIYGVFLYTDKKIKVDRYFLLKLILCIVTVTVLVNLGLNTLWIMMITHRAAKILIPIRFFKQICMVPVEIIVMYILTQKLEIRVNEYKEIENDLFEEC